MQRTWRDWLEKTHEHYRRFSILVGLLIAVFLALVIRYAQALDPDNFTQAYLWTSLLDGPVRFPAMGAKPLLLLLYGATVVYSQSYVAQMGVTWAFAVAKVALLMLVVRQLFPNLRSASLLVPALLITSPSLVYDTTVGNSHGIAATFFLAAVCLLPPKRESAGSLRHLSAYFFLLCSSLARIDAIVPVTSLVLLQSIYQKDQRLHIRKRNLVGLIVPVITLIVYFTTSQLVYGDIGFNLDFSADKGYYFNYLSRFPAGIAPEVVGRFIWSLLSESPIMLVLAAAGLWLVALQKAPASRRRVGIYVGLWITAISVPVATVSLLDGYRFLMRFAYPVLIPLLLCAAGGGGLLIDHLLSLTESRSLKIVLAIIMISSVMAPHSFSFMKQLHTLRTEGGFGPRQRHHEIVTKPLKAICAQKSEELDRKISLLADASTLPYFYPLLRNCIDPQHYDVAYGFVRRHGTEAISEVQGFDLIVWSPAVELFWESEDREFFREFETKDIVQIEGTRYVLWGEFGATRIFERHPTPQEPGSHLLRGDTEGMIALERTGGLYKGQTVRRGDSFSIRLYWRVLHPVPVEHLAVFCHLRDTQQNTIAQADFPDLSAGEENAQDFFMTRHDISVPRDVPPGRYQIRVGLYYSDDIRRLHVVGDNSGENAIALGEIHVE